MAANNQVVWQDARVVEVEAAADGIARIVLETDDPRHAPPGSHVDLLVTIHDRPVVRSYSVVRSEDRGRLLTISVHLSPTSRGGSRFMHALTPGDALRVTQPLQNFPLGVGAPRYVLLAGGIGVTAMLAMGQALKARGADYLFVYVGRSRPAMAYLDELAAEHGDRFRAHVDDEGDGLVVEELLAEIATAPLATETEMYVCGPIRLMDAVRRAWLEHGLAGPNLRFETFGNSGSWEAEEFVVRIPDLDREVVVDANTSMLEALEGAGVDVMWDCRKGECGLCAVRVRGVEGQVDHRDVFLSSEQQKQSRSLCCCVSRVASTPSSGTTAVLTIDLP